MYPQFMVFYDQWSTICNQHAHFYNKSSVSSNTAVLVQRCFSCRNETRNENIVISYLGLKIYSNGDDEDLHFVVEDLIFPPFKGLKTWGQFIELPGGYDFMRFISHCDGIICLTVLATLFYTIQQSKIQDYSRVMFS